MLNLVDIQMYFKYYCKIVYLEYYKIVKRMDYVGRVESNKEKYRGYEGCYPVSKLLKSLNITNNDSIIDIGCGKGLFLYYASKYPFSKIAGIDYSEELINIAKNNILKINDERIILECCDALEYDRFCKYNYYFINNPFVREIMDKLVDIIIDSCTENSREITIIYQFPFNKDLFVSKGFVIIYDVFPNCILRLNPQYDSII